MTTQFSFENILKRKEETTTFSFDKIFPVVSEPEPQMADQEMAEQPPNPDAGEQPM
jgi:hypothetical protein